MHTCVANVLILVNFCSDDLSIKVWGADIMSMQCGGGYAPW